MKKSIVTAFFTALSIGAYAQGETSSNHLYWILGGVVVVVALVYYVLNQKKTERRKMQLDDRPHDENLSVKDNKKDESNADQNWRELAEDAYKKGLYQETISYCIKANESGCLDELDNHKKAYFYHLWGTSLAFLVNTDLFDKELDRVKILDLLNESVEKHEMGLALSTNKFGSSLICILVLQTIYFYEDLENKGKYRNLIDEKYQQGADLNVNPGYCYGQWAKFLHIVSLLEEDNEDCLKLAYEKVKLALPNLDEENQFHMHIIADDVLEMLYEKNADDSHFLQLAIEHLDKAIELFEYMSENDYSLLCMLVYKRAKLRGSLSEDKALLLDILPKLDAKSDIRYLDLVIILSEVDKMKEAFYYLEQLFKEGSDEGIGLIYCNIRGDSDLHKLRADLRFQALLEKYSPAEDIFTKSQYSFVGKGPFFQINL